MMTFVRQFASRLSTRKISIQNTFYWANLGISESCYSACRRWGGVLKCPRFGVESWAAAHGRYRWHQVAWAHRNTAFNGGICQQNMHFNMYTTISKPQEGSTCKDSHAKCFMATNSTVKLSPGAMNRSELWERVSNACFSHLPLCFHLKLYTSIKRIFYWIIFTKHPF